jgi:hypothetical protein
MLRPAQVVGERGRVRGGTARAAGRHVRGAAAHGRALAPLPLHAPAAGAPPAAIGAAPVDSKPVESECAVAIDACKQVLAQCLIARFLLWLLASCRQDHRWASACHGWHALSAIAFTKAATAALVGPLTCAVCAGRAARACRASPLPAADRAPGGRTARAGAARARRHHHRGAPAAHHGPRNWAAAER